MTRLLLLLCCTLAFGQSYFNVRGLGEVSPPADARSLAIGSPAALAPTNPGLFVNLDKARFTLSVLGAGALGEEQGNTRFIGTVRPLGLHSAVPLPLGFRVLLGLDPKLNQDFDIWLPDTVYRYHVSGRGGTYTIRAGVAKSLFGIACMGAEYNRWVGSSSELRTVQVTEGTYTSSDTVVVVYGANTFRIGTAVQTSGFAFGLIYEPRLRLDAHSYWRIHGSAGDTVRSIELDHVVSAAVGYQATRRLSLAAGFEYRPWFGTMIDGDSLGLKASVGAEYDLFSDWPIRVGYSYEDWYYQARLSMFHFELEPITSHGIHVGTSVPIPGFGSLDLGLAVSRRETSALTETAGKLMLSLAYAEPWHRRTRRWGY